MKSTMQIEKIVDQVNVALDRIRNEQEARPLSITQYQSFALFYEQVKTAQSSLRRAVREFERSQRKFAASSQQSAPETVNAEFTS